MHDSSQITDTVIMVNPDHFGFNPQTAQTNFFQKNEGGSNESEIRDKARIEFTQMTDLLRKHDIKVLTISSRKDAITPDAVFPNNWMSHHGDGTLVIYPMLAHNRRLERQVNNVITNIKKLNINHIKVKDLTHFENDGFYLEGTGSLVLDRVKHFAYAAFSARTSQKALEYWSSETGYRFLAFETTDQYNRPIYHTNIIMGLGDKFAVIASSLILDRKKRKAVLEKLSELGKEIIQITNRQMFNFCGNLLQLKNIYDQKKIVLSQTAYDSFTAKQKKVLEQHGEFIVVNIPTIETIGGGSARCMLLEIFH